MALVMHGGAPDRLRQVLDRADELGVFPDVAHRIQQVVKDPRAQLSDMQRAVELDPALSARILKIANSPFYGLKREVGSLKQALQVLGFYPTRDLAVAITLGALGRNGDNLQRGLWKHSLSTAVATRHLARYIRGVDRDVAFLAGMMHDIGMFLLYQLEPVLYVPLMQSPGPQHPALPELERQAFGFDHAQLGAEALRRWSLPEALCSAVLDHHKPSRQRCVQLINLAEFMAENVTADRATDLVMAHPANRVLRVPAGTVQRIMGVLEEDVRALGNSV